VDGHQLGNEVDIFEHPNQERYPGQQISVVLVEGYVYHVQFVEKEEEIFFKDHHSKPKGYEAICWRFI